MWRTGTHKTDMAVEVRVTAMHRSGYAQRASLRKP